MGDKGPLNLFESAAWFAFVGRYCMYPRSPNCPENPCNNSLSTESQELLDAVFCLQLEISCLHLLEFFATVANWSDEET